MDILEVITEEVKSIFFRDFSLWVAERIRQSPEFDVGILGQGIMDKKRAIDEVQKRTSIGRALIDVEQRMMRMLIKRAFEGNL